MVAISTRRASPDALAPLLARRREPTRALAAHAEAVVACCAAMAERFRAGGTLYVLSPTSAASDAAHVAVEFLHPVLVGKRALPARHVSDPASLELFAGPADIALAVGLDGPADMPVGAALRRAGERGVLTVALATGDVGADAADIVLPADGDALVAQELGVTTYHLLWEVVHVCLEQGDVVGACVGDGHCPTCADEADPVRVLELLDGGLAVVETARGREQVSVALVDAVAGDTVLVHAGEAIAVVSR